MYPCNTIPLLLLHTDLPTGNSVRFEDFGQLWIHCSSESPPVCRSTVVEKKMYARRHWKSNMRFLTYLVIWQNGSERFILVGTRFCKEDKFMHGTQNSSFTIMYKNWTLPSLANSPHSSVWRILKSRFYGTCTILSIKVKAVIPTVIL
jgi:hypothetical protein